MHISKRLAILMILALLVTFAPDSALANEVVSDPGGLGLTDPKADPLIDPLPARPDNGDPAEVLASSLQQALRAGVPDSFAGVVITDDGNIEVYATGGIVAILEVIRGTEDNVRDSQPGVSLPQVRVVEGCQNTIASLEAVHEEITARSDELVARGIELREWGVDVWANKTRIGVEALTPDEKQFLEREFGLGRVEAYERGKWGTASRSRDSSPWWGGVRLSASAGGPLQCTAGFVMARSETIREDNKQKTVQRRYMATAGHCGWGDWFNAKTKIGDTRALRYGNGGRGDMQVIGPISGQGYAWIAENTILPVETYYESQVAGSKGICADGAVSGENCTSRIIGINNCQRSWQDDETTCGLIIVGNSRGFRVQPGDSGGPVYTKRSNGFLAARGVIYGRYEPNPAIWAYTPIITFHEWFDALPLCYC